MMSSLINKLYHFRTKFPTEALKYNKTDAGDEEKKKDDFYGMNYADDDESIRNTMLAYANKEREKKSGTKRIRDAMNKVLRDD